MNEFPLIRKTLSGGFRVILLPREQMQTVTFLVLIGVGSRYETPEQNGLSHFLEHMFFKGTKKRPTTKEIAEAIDNVGGEFNAFTGEEFTGYYVKVAKEHLSRAGDVVSDILLRPLFPAEEIERERGVIIEEIRMYTDQPMRHVQHLWQEALYGDHPLGRRIDGSVEKVSAFQRPDFLDYVKRHYHTENAVVIVAGNFSEKKMLAELTELFSELPKSKETIPPRAPGSPQKRFVFEKRSSIDQTHLVVGVPGLALSDPDRWAGELLAVVLGGGMSSRMFLQVREQHGLAYAVRTSLDSYVDTGSFATQAGLRTNSALLAAKLMMAEYDSVMEKTIPDMELAKAKQIVRGQMVLELEETNALAVFAGSQELLEKNVETPQEMWKKIQAVTAADLQRLAQRLLIPKKRTIALLGPQKSTRSFEKLLV